MKAKLILLCVVCVLSRPFSANAQYQLVRGKAYSIPELYQHKVMEKFEVTEIQGNVVIGQPYTERAETTATQDYKYHGQRTDMIKTYAGSELMFTNFNHYVHVGQDFIQPVPAIMVGQTSVRGTSADFLTDIDGRNISQAGTTRPATIYDCGTYYEPPPKPLTPEQQAAHDAAKQAAAEKTFLLLQKQADEGSTAARYSLGLRYLNGNGCETNRTEAIRWLNLASIGGNLDASNKLASLK